VPGGRGRRSETTDAELIVRPSLPPWLCRGICDRDPSSLRSSGWTCSEGLRRGGRRVPARSAFQDVRVFRRRRGNRAAISRSATVVDKGASLAIRAPRGRDVLSLVGRRSGRAEKASRGGRDAKSLAEVTEARRFASREAGAFQRAARARPADGGWWTRSQSIRTAGEIPFEAALFEATEPAYLRIAQSARWLRELGLSLSQIAAELGVTDKTVRRALRA